MSRFELGVPDRANVTHHRGSRCGRRRFSPPSRRHPPPARCSLPSSPRPSIRAGAPPPGRTTGERGCTRASRIAESDAAAFWCGRTARSARRARNRRSRVPRPPVEPIYVRLSRLGAGCRDRGIRPHAVGAGIVRVSLHGHRRRRDRDRERAHRARDGCRGWSVPFVAAHRERARRRAGGAAARARSSRGLTGQAAGGVRLPIARHA